MLDITAETENWASPGRVSAARLREIVRSLGGADRFLVVRRRTDGFGAFLQVWHQHGAPFELEHRTAAGAHLGADLHEAGRVAETVVGWARAEADWDAGLLWEPMAVGPGVDVSELPKDVRAEIEEYVRELLRVGYASRDQLAEAAERWLSDEDEQPVSAAQARQLVEALWQERHAQTRRWPEVTDPDRVSRAFAELDAGGLTARENFACCRDCGLGALAEGGGPDRGFVFFDQQSAEHAAAGGGLTLYYGAFRPGWAPREIGHEVVAALERAGLRAQWDGELADTLRVPELHWRKRPPR
ncbi:DUF6891 domain-containing protein [Streptomyces physcomitrii]|uniref:DUF6891 domain-containing protein n=1 Tax=Streptomyces physcomitrii TaxID=2724184 RepID=A0ABX1H2Q1_9ACTN|nr:hypothetical protein [Streptomyces physcomitrii]NKI41539.1 hypothetical protein [Streptomyces physcomitrii]